jgi:hypothetical protein
VTDLTTVAAVKSYAVITTSADDALLAALVAAYSGWVRSYTHRDFGSVAYDIWRSGRDGVSMLVPQSPITAIALVQIDGVTIPAQPTFGSFGYRFAANAITLDGALFNFGRNNVHLQFTAGSATVPAEIAQACNELVALRYRLRDKLEWSTKALAGESVSLITKDMPAAVSTILNMYRLKVNV